MALSSRKCVITVKSLLKTSKPTSHLKPIELLEYSEDKNICVVSHLHRYLKLTEIVRGDCNKLFISYVKPHKAVSKDTIARWLKEVLQQSGIDTSVFGAHSTRSASTSAAKAGHLPINEILKAAGWSNAKTFGQYYNKTITDNVNYGNMLLSSVRKSTK